MSDNEAAGRAAVGEQPRPGDAGRRIALRRGELGLTLEQVADRAGVAAEYLRYVESQPADVDIGTVLRLAGALETTPDRLRGGEVDVPPGRAGPAARPVLTELPREECWNRLGTHGVGRIALSVRSMPTVLPVNYTVIDRAIVYRTTWVLATAAAVPVEVAFEVDRVDEALSQGWSVLAVGPAEAVTQADEMRRLAERAVSAPWAGGDRPAWVRITPREVTGRLIQAA